MLGIVIKYNEWAGELTIYNLSLNYKPIRKLLNLLKTEYIFDIFIYLTYFVFLIIFYKFIKIYIQNNIDNFLLISSSLLSNSRPSLYRA